MSRVALYLQPNTICREAIVVAWAAYIAHSIMKRYQNPRGQSFCSTVLIKFNHLNEESEEERHDIIAIAKIKAFRKSRR
jgi:hypothetical protein